jgi:DNA-directed RNA polymerase II subunit RPB2
MEERLKADILFASEEKKIRDLLHSYFASYGYCRAQHDSYFEFMHRMVKEIVEENNKVDLITKLDVTCVPPRIRRDVITLSNVTFGEPTATKNDGYQTPITSADARKSGCSFMTPIFADMEHKIFHSHIGNPDEPGIEYYHNILICSLPCMLRSPFDPLYETPDSLTEDENDSGGYFLVNRNERVVQIQLRKENNKPHVQKPSPSLASSASASRGSSSSALTQAAEKAKASNAAKNAAAAASSSSSGGGLLPPAATVTKSASKKYELTCEVRSWNDDKIRSTSTLFINVTSPRPGERAEIFVVIPYITVAISMVEVFRMCGVDSASDMKKYVCHTFGARDPDPEWEERSGNRCHDDCESNVLLERLVDSMLEHDALGKTLEEITDSIGRQGSTVPAERRHASITGVFKNEFLPHIGLERTTHVQRRKAVAFGYYCRKLLLVKLGLLPPDDRDWIGNSSVDPVGKLMAILFRQHMRNLLKFATKKLRSEIRNKKFVRAYDAFNPNMITNAFKYWLSTGMTDSQKNSGSNGQSVAQLLTRTSPMSFLSHLNRVNTPFNKDGKLTAPRRLNPSHWGIFCAIETPEGNQCGLIRHLALLTYVRTGNKAGALIALAHVLGMRDLFGQDAGESTNISFRRTREQLEQLHSQSQSHKRKRESESQKTNCEEEDSWNFGKPRRALIIVNGAVEGWIEDPRKFIAEMRRLRELQDIPFDTSIYFDEPLRTVHLNAQAGTLMRPVIQISKVHLFRRAYNNYQTYGRGESSLWDSMLLEGVIVMLDAHESSSLRIADSLLSVKSGVHSHCEVHPSVILGLIASQTPFSPCTPSPRLTYVTSMDKQNTGVPCLNYQQRMDTVFHVGWYHQTPIVPTMSHSVMHREDTPDGTNVIVMVGNFDGYQQEDAMVFSKDFLDRGAFRSDCYRTLRDEEKGSGADIEIFEKPDESCVSLKRGNYSKLKDDGFVPVRTKLEKHDICFGKVMYSSGLGHESRMKDVKRDVSTVYRHSETASVDRLVFSSSREGHTQVMMRVREPRKVGLADKFSSRHGQKGVVGLIVPGEDMPFTACGMKPDVIVNPEAFPSRMTIGQLIENVLGLAAAGEGRIFVATPFTKVPLEEAQEMLWKQGVNRFGQFEMYSGRTGLPLENQITLGIIHFQRLKRFAPDHSFARKEGPEHVLTRQPVEGKSRDGGLRIGHMEADCMIANGAADTVRDSLLERSDATVVMVCRKCGLFAHRCKKLGDQDGGGEKEMDPLELDEAIANNYFDLLGPRSKTGGWCRGCKTGDHVETNVCLPYATKLCFQELEPMHIAPRIILSDPQSAEDVTTFTNETKRKKV